MSEVSGNSAKVYKKNTGSVTKNSLMTKKETLLLLNNNYYQPALLDSLIHVFPSMAQEIDRNLFSTKKNSLLESITIVA